MKKVKAHMILNALAIKHERTDDAFFTEVKNGSTWYSHNLLRLDAVAIKKSWKQPCITGYEVKVDRQDFLRDEKWPLYKDCCNRLYFACPTGLIEPNEIPDDIGLIWFNPEKKSLYTKRKALFRNIEMPVDLLYYLVICRLDSDRHPFFSSRRERLEDWVQDKYERIQLGNIVSNKMSQQLTELRRKAQNLEWEANRYKEADKRLKEIKQVLIEAGVIRNGYHTHEKLIASLKKVLKTKIPPSIISNLQQIELEVAEANKAIKKYEERTGQDETRRIV